MLLTKKQISEQMRKHAEKKNGFQDLIEIMLESMMPAERGEFLSENPGNKGNGYRPGHSYGQGKRLEFRIPRDRYGNFHQRILAILRDQEEECDRLAGVLYTKGLRSTIRLCLLTAFISRYTASVLSQVRRSMWRWP